MKLRIARKICKYMGHGYPISNIGRLKEIDGHEIVLTNRIFAPLEQTGKFLKNNIISSFHEDIDKAVANEDYKELLKYINIVENTLTNLKKKLVIAILEK